MEEFCEAAESGRHSWVNLHQFVGGETHFAWGRQGGLHAVEVCALCGSVTGSVPVDVLADYYGEHAPQGLDPDSDLASEIHGRRLLSLREELEQHCAEVRVPGPDAYPFSPALVLLGLRAEDVEHVAEMVGDDCEVAEFEVEEEGWARSPSLVWRLGSVLDGLEDQSVYIAWVR